jgi:hypothetical protein
MTLHASKSLPIRDTDSPQVKKTVTLGRWKNLSCGLEAVGRPFAIGIGTVFRINGNDNEASSAARAQIQTG